MAIGPLDAHEREIWSQAYSAGFRDAYKIYSEQGLYGKLPMLETLYTKDFGKLKLSKKPRRKK